MTLENLKQAFKHLSDAERASFASFVLSEWREKPSEFTAEEIAEFERRAEEAKKGTSRLYTAKEIKQELRQTYGYEL